MGIVTKSIIQKEKECYKCQSKTNLHSHHIFFGKNREKSEKDGMKVYLCYEHHEGTNGVHGKNGHELDIELKKLAEKRWLEYYKKEKTDFIERYGKNYL